MSIEVRDISVIHPKGSRQTLSNISFDVPHHALTLIVGKTGAGKSTLLEVLSGQREPDCGTVRYDEEPLWGRQGLSRTVLMELGYVFQYPEHQLFSQSVEAELAYSLRPYRLESEEQSPRMDQALADVGIPLEFKSRSPFLLSTGQKRRTALATTFATHPRWLMLDEPTAGLDPSSVLRLTRWLDDFRRTEKRSVIIATHDLDTFLPIADQVIVLSEGRLLCNQSPADLCQDPNVFHQAAIGVPDRIQCTQRLRNHGVRVNTPLISADELSQQIATYINSQQEQPRRDAQLLLGADSEDIALPTRTVQAHSSLQVRSVADAIDPRVKWCLYTAMSAIIMLQTSWIGFIVSVAALCVVGRLARMPMQHLRMLWRPFVVISIVSFVIAGVKLGDAAPGAHIVGSSVRFSMSTGLVTFFSLCKLYALVIAGLIFTACTSPLQMKQGLTTLFRVLARFHLPVEAVALGASLIFRFIPLISKELERFAKIARARGKRTKRRAGLRIRELHVVLIPFVLAVLQLGDDLANAMEARGYHTLTIGRTSNVELRLNRTDWLTLFFGLIGCALLLLVRYAS